MHPQKEERAKPLVGHTYICNIARFCLLSQHVRLEYHTKYNIILFISAGFGHCLVRQGA